MKKEWKTPTLEVLDVSETLAGYGDMKPGSFYADGKLIEIDMLES